MEVYIYLRLSDWTVKPSLESCDCVFDGSRHDGRVRLLLLRRGWWSAA